MISIKKARTAYYDLLKRYDKLHDEDFKVARKLAEMLGIQGNYTYDWYDNSARFDYNNLKSDILAQIKLDDETLEEKRRIDRLTPKSKRAEKMEEANDD